VSAARDKRHGIVLPTYFFTVPAYDIVDKSRYGNDDDTDVELLDDGRRKQPPDSLEHYDRTGSKYQKTLDGGRQKLGFAVPERMIAIFGLERDIDGIQRDKARSHIDGALQGVGKDTYGRGNKVRRNFSDKD
jgi:hypothetical protein